MAKKKLKKVWKGWALLNTENGVLHQNVCDVFYILPTRSTARYIADSCTMRPVKVIKVTVEEV